MVFRGIEYCPSTKKDIKICMHNLHLYLINIQTDIVLKTMTTTDETTRDIVKFFKGFSPNICCCEVTYTSSLIYGETEETTEGLPVEIKKKSHMVCYVKMLRLTF